MREFSASDMPTKREQSAPSVPPDTLDKADTSALAAATDRVGTLETQMADVLARIAVLEAA